MMDNGIGMDMVSLSGPPLHTAPLFVSQKLVPVEVAPANPQEAASAAAAKAKEHEQQCSQHGADSPVAVERRSGDNGDEPPCHENPTYEARAVYFWLCAFLVLFFSVFCDCFVGDVLLAETRKWTESGRWFSAICRVQPGTAWTPPGYLWSSRRLQSSQRYPNYVA